MRYLVKKDKKLRLIFKKKEINILIEKYLFLFLKNSNIKYNFLIKNKRYKIKNRCLLTGRSKAVFGKLGLTRHQIKFLVKQRLLLGIKKSSW